jgi:hypothetical protein
VPLPTFWSMARVLVVAGVVAVLGLTGCGTTGSGTSGDPTDAGVPQTTNPITGPIDRAESVVDDLNARLRQEDQRGSLDLPTP